jgi:hypothetical protein
LGMVKSKNGPPLLIPGRMWRDKPNLEFRLQLRKLSGSRPSSMSALPQKRYLLRSDEMTRMCQERLFLPAICRSVCQHAPADPFSDAGQGAGDPSTQVRLSSVVWNGPSVSISVIGCVFWFHLK